MKKIIVLMILVLALPCLASAEVDFDLRLKGGIAAGLDEMNIDPIVNATGSADDSTNVQLELAFVPLARHTVGPVFTLGFFDRKHSGTVSDFFNGLPTTSVDYEVAGVTLGAGVSLKPTNNWNFEGRVEAAIGEGKPTLSTPGFVWNSVKEDSYVALSFIIGSYYTFTMPRIQLGLEVGIQSFTGDFQILSNGGYWMDGDVQGTGGIANVSVGYRF